MMRGKPDRKDILLFLNVSAACGALIVGGVITAQLASDHLLRRDAEATAAIWAEYISQNVDIDGVLAGDPIPAESQMYFDQARQAGRVFLYEIFDARGLVVLSSDGMDGGGISNAQQTLKYFKPKIIAGDTQVQMILKT